MMSVVNKLDKPLSQILYSSGRSLAEVAHADHATATSSPFIDLRADLRRASLQYILVQAPTRAVWVPKSRYANEDASYCYRVNHPD